MCRAVQARHGARLHYQPVEDKAPPVTSRCGWRHLVKVKTVDLDEIEPPPCEWRELIERLRHPDQWRELSAGERRVLADLAQGKRKLPKDAISYRTHFRRLEIAETFAILRADGVPRKQAMHLVSEGYGISEPMVGKCIRHFIARRGRDRWRQLQDMHRRLIAEEMEENGG